ncbi:hypothetical protein KKA95_00775 [Patescibacteria group bacterium]|nr:hypothetical protein [Patescibacteria group bacterium]
MEGVEGVIQDWSRKLRSDKEGVKQSIQSRDRADLMGIEDYLSILKQTSAIVEIKKIVVSSLRERTNELLVISIAQLKRLTPEDKFYNECEKRVRELREELKRLSHLS